MLNNVTLVIPAVELKAIRHLMLGDSGNVTSAARIRMLVHLGDMQGAAALLGTEVQYVEYLGLKSAPGSIIFPVFSWFGISGTNVAFTATPPSGAGALMPVLGSIVNTTGEAAPPGPPPPVGAPPVGATPSSSGSSLKDWQLGLIIAGTVMGSVAAAFLAVLVLRLSPSWTSGYLVKV